MTMATIGIDIASVDGNGTPSWSDARTFGHLRFVGLRAAYGTAADSWYPTYRTQLDAIGVPNFPYLFLRANVDTPELQAQKLLKVIGTLNDHYFPPAIDVEGDRHGLTPAQWLDWVTRAVNVVRDKIGVPPLIYSSRTYWIDPDGMNNLPAPQLADCTPWWKYWPFPVRSPAVYTASVVDGLHAPPAPPPWGDAWIIQQYQGDGLSYPGFKSTVDLNRINVQKQGAHGDSVKWIQRRLPGLKIDGDFGQKTGDAVEAFQKLKRLTPDRIVGLDTAQLLAWQAPRS